MPGLPLQNVRWEKFCQAYVQGPTAGNATASFVAAGFGGDGTQVSRTGAYKHMNKPPVRARIAELQADAVLVAQRAVISAAERESLSKQLVLAQLGRLAFANVLDYVRRSETGGIVIDIGAVKRDEGAGIAELTVTERGEGPDRTSSVRIKLCDRHAPLVSLGKYLGLFGDRKQDPHEHLRHLSADELRRHNAALEQKVALERPRAVEQAVDAPQASLGEPSSTKGYASELEGVTQNNPDVTKAAPATAGDAIDPGPGSMPHPA